jgi:hypothetical protein
MLGIETARQVHGVTFDGVLNVRNTGLTTAHEIEAWKESHVIIEPEVATERADIAGVIANAAARIADAITPANAGHGADAAGGHVESLTEAAMGITAGLCRIADAINALAEAVAESANVSR